MGRIGVTLREAGYVATRNCGIRSYQPHVMSEPVVQTIVGAAAIGVGSLLLVTANTSAENGLSVLRAGIGGGLLIIGMSAWLARFL